MASSLPTARRGRPSRPTAKRASKVADRIVEDVMAMGWPVGEVMGSEAELLERYEVSRAVFREAVRLVENQQVARTRRGPGGGLVVTEPTVDAVIEAVVLHLHRVDARLDEVFEARVVLEEIATELAASRLDEDDLAVLRAHVDDSAGQARGNPRALHSLIAGLSRNPALELFVEVLNRIALLYSTDGPRIGKGTHAETARAHSRIAEALLAGDSGLARHRMGKHLEAEADYLRRRRSSRQMLPDQVVLADGEAVKRAESVARHITYDVIAAGREPGELIGTETELIEREGVSRAVFREAVRLLEHHQVARMRRGPGGGLFVVEANAAAVTDIAAIYLARRDMQLADLAELRTGVEVAIVALAASRIDDDGTTGIREALEREEHEPEEMQPEVIHDLHAAVAAAAQNRVLELVALVLIRLSRLRQIERLAPKARQKVRAEVLRAHEGIAAAVGSGDLELSRHRMKRHLDALAALIH